MKTLVSCLEKLFGKRRVAADAATLKEHAADAWLVSHLPEAVVFADSSECVSRLMVFANRYRIPITVRGGGRGYVGGCVPIRGGIVLSLTRMNRIRSINPEAGLAEAEAGVITENLQIAARKKGMFYPPDPASLHDCTIGGNIATNAGGPRCLKYGVTRHYVLGLEVVLSSGEIIQVGGRTHKNKTGFDLTGLFVGSEGLLGVVTLARLRLIPHPLTRACIAGAFRDEHQASRCALRALTGNFLPAALEIADRFTLAAARKLFQSKGHRGPEMKLLEGNAHLLLELDGRPDSVRAEMRDLARFLRKNGALHIQTAFGDSACEKLWELRRQFSPSLKTTGLLKLNEDVTVPRDRLGDFFVFTRHLREKYGLMIACFGHAGDGNIHFNLMLDQKDPRQVVLSERILDELLRRILSWGGAITGEHGIGLAKKKWWPLAVSKTVGKLHGDLKKLLDPRGILNPGKFV